MTVRVRPRPPGRDVRVRPRPPGRDVRDRRVYSALERLREQQALIEEARRRARRRRQRYALALLGGVAVVVVLGFAGATGGYPRDASDASDASAPSGSVVPTAINGKIAFADLVGLQVADPDGSEARLIAPCPSPCWIAEPAWSPDGRQIAFVQHDPGETGDQDTFSLYLVDSDGGPVRRLTACGSCGVQYGGHLSWSPDSSWIAFSREGSRLTQSLWAVDTAGDKLRRLTKCQLCVDVSPDWAPSGHLIVFSRIAEGGSSLYTVRADSSHLNKITDSASAANPQWSPDGRQIAFDGRDEIFIADADGSNQKRLVDGDGQPGSGPGVPSWSPDGTKLAYFYTPGSPGKFTAEVWTMTTDGSEKRRLYHSACCVGIWEAPIWSPDGTKIAFAADSADGTFVIAADGTGLLRLSTASANGITWQRRAVSHHLSAAPSH